MGPETGDVRRWVTSAASMAWNASVVVVVSLLCSLVQRLAWGRAAAATGRTSARWFMPPGQSRGLMAGTHIERAGHRRMRNSPVEAKEGIPWLLEGIALALPALVPAPRTPPMQSESGPCARWSKKSCRPGLLAISIDCHSGFG